MGWVRANIIYEKAARPPEPGSPMEILFLLVWNMRQNIEFQKQRTTLQALLSQKGAESEEILKAFDDLKASFFPFDKNAKADDLKRMRQALEREVARGGLAVEPLIDTYRPKIQSKLMRGQERLAERHAQRVAGTMVGIDVFDRARKRPRRDPAHR